MDDILAENSDSASKSSGIEGTEQQTEELKQEPTVTSVEVAPMPQEAAAAVIDNSQDGATTEDAGGRLPKPASLSHELPLQASVTRPQKVGDGISAYVAYTVSHATRLPHFSSRGGSVRRRFSDFLALWELLRERYAKEGIVLPPRPEKSALGAAKVKVASAGGSSEDPLAEDEFVERRRGELERFLGYCCEHPRLRQDADLRDFLERPGEPPKSPATGGVGGALKAFASAVGNTVAGVTIKVEETDQWFEDKAREARQLECVLRPVYSAAHRLAVQRRDYARQSRQFASSLARLAAAEESLLVSPQGQQPEEATMEAQSKRLAVAFERLANTQERIGQLQAAQAECELAELCEQVRHQLALLDALRAALQERARLRRAQLEAEAALAKRRDERTRQERSGRPERMAACEAAVKEAESQAERCRAQFEAASDTVKTEADRLEIQRGHELRCALLCAMEHQLLQQQQVLDAWQGYLPEARKILPSK